MKSEAGNKKRQIISRTRRVSERYLTRTFINVLKDIFHYHISPRLRSQKCVVFFGLESTRAHENQQRQRTRQTYGEINFTSRELFISLLILIEKLAKTNRIINYWTFVRCEKRLVSPRALAHVSTNSIKFKSQPKTERVNEGDEKQIFSV